MADEYIDLEELQIYGPYAAKQIMLLMMGLIPEFDPAMQKLSEKITSLTNTTKEVHDRAKGASTDIRLEGKAKKPLVKQGVALLGRFSKHLDSHDPQTTDRRTFFPEDGTASGVGRSASKVLLALERLAQQLKKEGCPVHDRERWQKDIDQAIVDLSPKLDTSNSAHTERAKTTPELENARQAWLQVYIAAKCGVECVLRLVDKLSLMSSIFMDLAVADKPKAADPPQETKEVKPPWAQ